MMDIPTRRPVPGDSWRTSSSRSAGLYGELPPLPAYLPANTALAARPPRKGTTLD